MKVLIAEDDPLVLVQNEGVFAREVAATANRSADLVGNVVTELMRAGNTRPLAIR